MTAAVAARVGRGQSTALRAGSIGGSRKNTAYVIGSLAMVMVGTAVLRSAAFGRVDGYIGIVSGLVGLGI